MIQPRFLTCAAVLGWLCLTATAAQATLISVSNFYTNANTAASDTVTVDAEFDSAGISGVGIEKVQVAQMELLFTKRGFPQAPTIVPTLPDTNGNFPHGTFLAIFNDGAFDFLVSEDQGGGFASAPATVRPGDGPFSAVFIALTQFGLTERIGFTGIGRYELARQTVTTQTTSVPAPPAFWLFGIGLLGLGMLRRTKQQKR